MVHPLRPQDRSDRHYRLLIGTAAFVIIAAGIREAAEVLNSILLAMLLTVTVVPAFDALRRRGVPKGLAVVLTSLLLAGVLVVLLGTLGLSGTRLIQVLPQYQDRAQALRDSLEGLMVSRRHPARAGLLARRWWTRTACWAWRRDSSRGWARC